MTMPNPADVKNTPAPSAQTPPAGGQPGVTPTPGAEPGATGGQPAKDQEMVPIRALHEEREKRQALQQQTQTLTEQMAQMQTMMSQLQTPAPGQNPQHMGSTTYGTSPQARQLEELWETDPRRAMQAEMMMGFQWYDQTGGQVEDEMDRAAKEFKDFDKFRPDVRKYLRTMPPQERPKPNVIRLAYFAVRGQNVDSLWKEKQEELFRKIKSGEQVAGFNSGTTPSSTAPKQKSLNEEQTKAAEAMGVPLDEYLKYVR